MRKNKNNLNEVKQSVTAHISQGLSNQDHFEHAAGNPLFPSMMIWTASLPNGLWKEEVPYSKPHFDWLVSSGSRADWLLSFSLCHERLLSHPRSEAMHAIVLSPWESSLPRNITETKTMMPYPAEDWFPDCLDQGVV